MFAYSKFSSILELGLGSPNSSCINIDVSLLINAISIVYALNPNLLVLRSMFLGFVTL
ncbi:hypothetical protein RchiOBHm_Chr1g0319421 [Rosa chinensis]|uniref:Uncharacterized protein n=1 Tax=Rosa chinensis TaxID=74649 RepID=A0A2P6S8I8_ROSCH|nr:hypothetical protein RchiOBHm_Chr1g0319421 [Rosa chinensis]